MKSLQKISKILSDTYLKNFDKNRNHNLAKEVALKEIQSIDIRCLNPIAICEFNDIMDKAYEQNLIN